MQENKATAEPKTVRTLLTHLLDKGDGSTTAYTFPLSVPGLENYVLRVENPSSLIAFLRQSTSLTPIPRLVTGRHIGQPLMLLDGDGEISIHLKQPGVTLKRLYRNELKSLLLSGENLTREDQLQTAWAQMLEKIVALDEGPNAQNPFIPILEDAYASALSHHTPDLHANNLLFDEAHRRLGLIDQLDPSGKMATSDAIKLWHKKVDTLRSRLTSEYQFDKQKNTPLGARYTHAATTVAQLITAAETHVLATHANDKPSEYKGLVFAKVDDIQAVSLDDPPYVLVERLRQLAQRANIPGFAL